MCCLVLFFSFISELFMMNRRNRNTWQIAGTASIASTVGSMVGSTVGSALEKKNIRNNKKVSDVKIAKKNSDENAQAVAPDATRAAIDDNRYEPDKGSTARPLPRCRWTHENLVMMYSQECVGDGFEEDDGSDLDDMDSILSESGELCSILGSFERELEGEDENGDELEEIQLSGENEETVERDLSDCDLCSLTSNAVDVAVARIQLEERVAEARRRRNEQLSERQNLAAEHVSSAALKRSKFEEEQRKRLEEMQQQLETRLEAAEQRRNIQNMEKKMYLQEAQRRRETALLRASILAASARKLAAGVDSEQGEYAQQLDVGYEHAALKGKLFAAEGAELVRILASVGALVAPVFDFQQGGKFHFQYMQCSSSNRHEASHQKNSDTNLLCGYELKRLCEQLEDIMLSDPFAPCSPSSPLSSSNQTNLNPNRSLCFDSPEPESSAAMFPSTAAAATEKRRRIQLLPYAAIRFLSLALLFIEDNIQFKASENTVPSPYHEKPTMNPSDLHSADEKLVLEEQTLSRPTPTKRECIKHEDPCDVTLRRRQGKVNPVATPDQAISDSPGLTKSSTAPAYIIPSFLTALTQIPATATANSESLTARVFPFLNGVMTKKFCGKGLILAHHLVLTKAIKHVDQKKKDQMMGLGKHTGGSRPPVTATCLAEDAAVKLVAAMQPFYAPILKDDARRDSLTVSVLETSRDSATLAEEEESNDDWEIGLLPDIKGHHIVALLEAWELYVKHSAAAEAESKKQAVEELPKMFVSLHLAMIDREADIRAKQERAKAAVERTGNEHCPEMRRERLVQEKRKAVTTAMARQLQTVKSKLRRFGGDESYTKAENTLKQRLRDRQIQHKRRLQRTNALTYSSINICCSNFLQNSSQDEQKRNESQK